MGQERNQPPDPFKSKVSASGAGLNKVSAFMQEQKAGISSLHNVITRKQGAVVAFILMFSVLAFASEDVWQRFNSSHHFSVAYPGAWFRFGVSPDRLQIRSSKGGAEGIVIDKGQAEIVVMEADGSPAKTLVQVIKSDTQGAVVLSTRDVPTEPNRQSCSVLKEVISKEEAIPAEDSPISVPLIINTEILCVIDGHVITTLLRNWEGDSRQEDYRQVALQMAKSIRMTQRK